MSDKKKDELDIELVLDTDQEKEVEMIMLSEESYNDLMIDREMDTVAAQILHDYIHGLRGDHCTCIDCIVEEMAAEHGGIQ